MRRRFMRTRVLLAATMLCGSLWWLPRANALDVGAHVQEIGLKDLEGHQVDLASLKGKVVIVDFLASWCAPCKQELPVLDRLYKKYKDQGLVVIGVSVDQDLENLRDLLKQVKVSFGVVHDKQHNVAGRYNPSRMPTSYVIDRGGVVRLVNGGFRTDDASKIDAEIKTLLAAH